MVESAIEHLLYTVLTVLYTEDALVIPIVMLSLFFSFVAEEDKRKQSLRVAVKYVTAPLYIIYYLETPCSIAVNTIIVKCA